MKKLFSSSVITLGVLFAVSCQKIEGPADDIFEKWEVKEFVATETTTYEHDENKPIFITIKEDLTYHLQLETNTCEGLILHISDQSLIFESPGCTEMCCDSPFALRFESMLPYISMYKVTGNTLRLYIKNWGFIECRLFEYQPD